MYMRATWAFKHGTLVSCCPTTALMRGSWGDAAPGAQSNTGGPPGLWSPTSSTLRGDGAGTPAGVQGGTQHSPLKPASSRDEKISTQKNMFVPGVFCSSGGCFLFAPQVMFRQRSVSTPHSTPGSAGS